MRRSAGLTLAETIIAIFILIAGFVVMSRLFHTALQYQASIDSQQIAVLLAERKLEEVRAWSKTTHVPLGTTPFTNWSGCPGSSGPTPDPDFPAYSVSVTTTAQDIYSPCSLFELEYVTAGDRKCLASSTRRIQVDVTWKTRTYTLMSLVSAPSGQPATNAVLVTPNAAQSIAAGAQRAFSAQATALNGQPLPDVCFLWYCAGTGDGTVSQARNGKTVDLTNQIYDATPPPTGPQPTGVGAGPCTMVARARIFGREVSGVSGQIDLLP